MLERLLRLFRPAPSKILILDGEPVAATWGWRLGAVEQALAATARGESAALSQLPSPYAHPPKIKEAHS